MSEQTIQEDIQDTIQAMSQFSSTDVVINDWSILDGEVVAAPYIIIENSDQVVSRQDVKTANTRWDIPITLIVQFVDWTASLNEFRNRRQALINQFNGTDDYRSAGTSATTANVIRSDGPIDYIYDVYGDPEIVQEAEPVFISQRILFEFEEF